MAAAWYALAVLTIGAILSYTDRYIINVLVDGIRHDLKLDDIAISVVQGPAFAIMYAVAAIPFGMLADRYSRQKILIAGILLWSIGMAGCGLADSFTQLILSRCLVGIGEASFFPASLSLLANIFPSERRGLAFGALLMGTAIGAGAALSIGGTLLALLPPHLDWPWIPTGSSWRGVLIILGAAGLIQMLLIMGIREPARPAVPVGAAGLSGSVLLGLLKRGALFIVALALISAADAATSAWAPTFFTRALTFDPVAIAAQVGTVAIVAGATGYLLGGIFSDYLEARGVRQARELVTLGAAAAAFVGLTFVFGKGPFAIAGYATFVFAIGMATVAGAAAFLRQLPLDVQGSGTALLAFIMIMSGMASGPMLVAIVKTAFFGRDDQIGMAIYAVGSAALLPAIYLLARRFLADRANLAVAEPVSKKES